jgi:hypothetical protein
MPTTTFMFFTWPTVARGIDSNYSRWEADWLGDGWSTFFLSAKKVRCFSSIDVP